MSRAAVSLVLVAWVAGFLVGTARPTTAADLSQFRPGNIISDQVFFNPYTMNEAEIQAFLDQRGASCSGSLCLKNYGDTMPAKAGDGLCVGYPSSGRESAARLIYRVANSCGINPQVILVMLQKEQSLVTRTNPTTAVYQKAMGFGCPDTAACDAAYYGFANQIYSAARQFQAYANSGRFTWLKVGQVNQVRYHPNEACGTGSVLIENKATAGLYYYTPYQPNQAALNAGFGTGDGCSSYGNRNFYHYFTDWFGGAQSTSSLVQVPGQAEVWLVTGTSKHHVVNYSELVVFSSRFGGVRQVPASYLSSLSTGPGATRYVHDPSTGTLYLLQADGTKHRFPDVSTIESYGYAFNGYVNITSSQSNAFVTGPDVGQFFRIEDAPEAYVLDGRSKRYLTTGRAYLDLAAGKNSYVSSMAATGAAGLPSGPAVLPAHAIVRETNGGTVYLALADGSIIRIPTFGQAGDVGRREYIVVADGTLAQSTVVPGALSPFISCGGKMFLAAGGALSPVTGSDLAGFTPLQLTDAACAAMPRSTTQLKAPFFVQVPGQPEVYVLGAGQVHHVRSYARLMELSGGARPFISSWSSETLATAGVGAPELASGTFLQFSGQPEVYRGEGRTIRHVTSYDVLLREGGGRVPVIEKMPVSSKSYYTVGAPLS